MKENSDPLDGMLELIENNINYSIDTVIQTKNLTTSDRIKIMGILLEANQVIRKATDALTIAKFGR